MISHDNPTLTLNNNKALILCMYYSIQVDELTFTLQPSIFLTQRTTNECL